MSRGLRIPLLVMVLLGLGSADAYGAYDFTITPDPPNEDQSTTFRFQPASTSDVFVLWDLNGVGGFEQSGRVVSHTYTQPTAAGEEGVRVRMRVSDDDDNTTITKRVIVNGKPEVEFEHAPISPFEGEAVLFEDFVTDAQGDAVALAWDFGDGDSATGVAPSHTYGAAGSYDVTLVATDEHGASESLTREVEVRPDPGPTASFQYSPAAPLSGDAVTFSSTSQPSFGSLSDQDWDLDGDGEFDDASGPQATWTFGSAGVHQVLLRVRQPSGKESVAFADVNVAERPPDPPPPEEPGPSPPDDPGPGTTLIGGGGELTQPVIPQPKPLVRMRPFPVVRIAGVVLQRGALVRVLSVRTPKGALVRVRCEGRGCPAASVARTSATTRLLRFSKFERRLRAGIKLKVFVTKAGRIGKYTRFAIRAGRAPARIDRCLVPGRARPVSCP